MISLTIVLGSSNSFPAGAVPSLVLFNFATFFFFNVIPLLSIPFVHTNHFILVTPPLVVGNLRLVLCINLATIEGTRPLDHQRLLRG